MEKKIANSFATVFILFHLLPSESFGISSLTFVLRAIDVPLDFSYAALATKLETMIIGSLRVVMNWAERGVPVSDNFGRLIFAAMRVNNISEEHFSKVALLLTQMAMTQTENRWEHLPHGADITICGLGDSEAAAFEQAALALTAIVTDPATVVAAVPVEIACDAPDRELLLVEWLNALIYEMATRRMLFAQFEVRIDDHKLTATAWGEAIDLDRHELGTEIKGATCTNLKVAQEQSGEWRAQCVIDV